MIWDFATERLKQAQIRFMAETVEMNNRQLERENHFASSHGSAELSKAQVIFKRKLTTPSYTMCMLKGEQT